MTLLELIERATNLLSTSTYPTYGDIRFCFLNILENLKTYFSDSVFTQLMIANSIYHKLK